ncbi:unnamed protein product, partial [Rotaria magnacalcarata]
MAHTPAKQETSLTEADVQSLSFIFYKHTTEPQSDTSGNLFSSPKQDDFSDDIILNSNSSLNGILDFRRQKESASLTQTFDENQLTKTDPIEQNNSNQEDKVKDINETLESISLDEKQEDNLVKSNEFNNNTIKPSRFRVT